MTCIITGCTAILGGEYVGGDLHIIGNCYVFNAIVDEKCNPLTSFDPDTYSHYSKQIDFSTFARMYEKRGVYIAPISQCVLNEEAQNYVDRN